MMTGPSTVSDLQNSFPFCFVFQETPAPTPEKKRKRFKFSRRTRPQVKSEDEGDADYDPVSVLTPQQSHCLVSVFKVVVSTCKVMVGFSV